MTGGRVRLREDTVSYVTVRNKSKLHLVTLTQTTDSDNDSFTFAEEHRLDDNYRLA
jgi:hypothetical protein